MLFKNIKEINKENTKQKDLDKALIQAKNSFIHEFNRTMWELGLYNSFHKTYRLDLSEDTVYGYKGKLFLEPGLNFNKFKANLDSIEQYLQCMIIMDYEKMDSYATLKILLEKFNVDTLFSPVPLRPEQIFLGLGYDLQPVLLDLTKNYMYLLAGCTGSGKTVLIYLILLSSILAKSPEDFELYLGDIAKDEFNMYAEVDHVRYYANDLEELYKMACYLEDEFKRRKDLIVPLKKKGIVNIKDYRAKTGNKMAYSIVLIDEFSIIVEEKTDSKEVKNMKSKILSVIKFLAKDGRAYGMYTFVATQKTTKDEMPAILKNMSSVKISLRSNDDISSEVIMGNQSAVGLADRVAVYSLNGGSKYDYMFTPCLTIDAMNAYLKPFQNNRGKIDLSSYKYLSEDDKKAIEKEKKKESKKKKKEEVKFENVNNDNEKKITKNLPYEIIRNDLLEVVENTKKEEPKKTEKKNGWFSLESKTKINDLRKERKK